MPRVIDGRDLQHGLALLEHNATFGIVPQIHYKCAPSPAPWLCCGRSFGYDKKSIVRFSVACWLGGCGTLVSISAKCSE